MKAQTKLDHKIVRRAEAALWRREAPPTAEGGGGPGAPGPWGA